MPRVKSSPRKCVKSKSGQSKRWIIVAPEDVMTSSENATPDIVKLKHPRSGQTAMFLFSSDNSSVQEIMAFQEKKGSWFINDSVQEDGKMHISTPIDPVFLVLPYLKKSKDEGRVLPLEDLLVDLEYPETHRLLKSLSPKYMNLVADRKGNEELNAWMYNEEKTMKWLKRKTEKVTLTLKDQNVSVDGSAVSNTYVMPSKLKDVDAAGYLSYACGLVSEYLPDELTSALRKYLDLPEEENLKRKLSAEKMVVKKPKLDQGEPGKQGVLDLTQTKKSASRGATAKEKSQQKAAAGSKTITSFFKKK